MNRHFDSHLQKTIITIHPGEFISTDEDVYIATVLGSCISIALYDIEKKYGGLNHFMLPISKRKDPLSIDDEGRFGNYAVELLINDMQKKGTLHKNLRAKVFGGGNVLNSVGDKINMTGLNNINFALQYLDTENIPIIANDTGGLYPRKIYFHPLTSKVFLKRIKPTGDSLETIKEREKQYLIQLQKAKEEAGDITLF